ncbi:MAG TPA: hypothetical protein PLK13_16245 [Xanthobacteraceae bacterium]|jgi:hypothetical protein|nr:MAG: hypothetical protein B7Y61_23520 [Rhizobiales bacterium 35-66-30]OZB05425.1 MAG: hypothetical protein B7X67_12070 [Rhizobiales bacterium 39-66-18]HQS10372.1 hypothetical protein [Xanthobacteraceae bacterium]
MRYAILALISASLLATAASARETHLEQQAPRNQQQTTTTPEQRDQTPVISEQDRLFLMLGDRGIGNG